MNNNDNKRGKKTFNNIWIVPYADFMTSLMILFLALFALASSQHNSKINYEKTLLELEGSLGTKTEHKMKFVDAAEKIQNSISDRGLQHVANVEVNAQRIKIVMAAPILFASGSAEINKDAEPILKELADIFRNLPNKITVEGHTCNIPVSPSCKYRSNLELSGARAFSVIRYLVENNDLNPDRFIALGCGENIPLKPNTNEENRSYNRRVEISIEKE